MTDDTRRRRRRALAAATLALALGACRGAPARQAAPRTPAPAVTPGAAPLAIGETFVLQSAAVGEARRINVWRPPAWAAPDSVPLPVLYMPDGGIEEDFQHVAGLLQVSIGNGTMRPFLLVGIENTQRRRDMTGPTTVESDRKIAPRVGGSAAFRRFVADELIPEVERRYRTTRERAIVGESLAGLFVVETFLLEPRLFDTYVAIDPSLWWNGGRLVADADSLLRASAAPRTLWMTSSGDALENVEAATRLAATLGRGAHPGVTWRYVPMPEERHATIYHPAALRAFRELFAPPPAPAK